MIAFRAALAVTLSLGASAALAAPASLPPGGFNVSGRTVTVSLPYRQADGLAWVSATRMSEMAPFAFKGLSVKPRGGPQGTDLAVFTYQAGVAGSATLKFGLVPNGQMLIGPPSMIYKGQPAARFEAKAAVK
jgi:hypothetical protein